MGNTKPFQLLEITIISAQDLEPKAKMNMRTYTTAWINPARKLTTNLDTEGGSNPTWNDKFVFRVDEAFLRQDTSAVQFEIYKLSWLGDTLIGTVRLVIGNLIPPPAAPNHHQNSAMRFAAIQVMRPSGRPQGILNIGVAVLDSSKRSVPSAAGYRHLTEEDNLPRNPALSRSRSDRSDFLALDSDAIPKKRKGKKRVEDDKESSILSISWYPPPPPPHLAKETNAKRKGHRKVDDDKESSVLSASWYARPPPPPPATSETNRNKRGKVEDDKESSIVSMSWYQPPPPPPPITTETETNRNRNKKGKVEDDKESSILSMSWYQPQPPPPPPMTTETNLNKKGKVEDDKESSILSMSWFQPPPPPPTTTETNLNKKGKKVEDDKESSILSMSWFQPPPPPITTETNVKPGKASSVINAADLKDDAAIKSHRKGKAFSVMSDSIMIKDSSPSGKISNKIEAQAENKEIVEENKNGPRFDESPTNKAVDGKPKVGGGKPSIPKIPGYDYGSVKGTGSKLVIGGGPYKANSIMSDSEVGPSPSEVAAAMAERPRYPLEDSVLDGWSCDESVEGLRSRLERWRTELPPLYDQGAYAPTSSSFRSSSKHTTKKRGGASGKGGGPFSCFGNIFGYECQCVCGQPKPKSRAAKGRLRSPSPFR